MRISVEEAQAKAYDLCIAGAGPAGIIVALEYHKLKPKDRVLLMEYGTAGGASRNRLDDSIKNRADRQSPSALRMQQQGIGREHRNLGRTLRHV